MHIPTATYRIQLHQEFNFMQLADILPYLHALGISTIYASPVTRAVPGSRHGYDVISPLEINPEIGTAETWETITSFLQEHGMGWLQDIVPNHMAYTSGNPWVYDVLERGRHADFCPFFDIIPQSLSTINRHPSTRIMLPFLEKELKACLYEGEIKLAFGEHGFSVQYKKQTYPIATGSYHWICAVIPDFYQPLLAWADKTEAFGLLPWQEWVYFKKRIWNEIWLNPRLKSLVGRYCHYINQNPALLEELLSFQHYQLCSSETSFTKINYRRFFAVNSLICLRMEDENVFNNWHPQLLSLYNQGLIQGFRIDHIDGLFDPGGYLEKLRTATGPDAYIVSEKILQENEETNPGWPVQGTTGYDFLSFVNQLLTDHSGKQKLLHYYQKQISAVDYPDLLFDKKITFLKSRLMGEWNNLLRWLSPCITLKEPALPPEDIKEALAVFIASLPVYRIYADHLPLSETDQQWISHAFHTASAKAPSLKEALNWLWSLFKIKEQNKETDNVLYFIRRWAQYTAPLAAKGVEDTVFYNFNALISHNEVGDSPVHSPVTAEKFHTLMIDRQQKAPLSMNTGSTHDTKRGEDNRLRINLISLYADEWIDLTEKWKQINQPFIRMHAHIRHPSANDEYLIYQALLGAIPEDLRISMAFRKRFGDYLTKALREEKQETQWENPNEVYEKDCHDFLRCILSPANGFLSSFLPFANKLISRSAVFSLSQTLIKLTAPGIPDIYQGAELWDLSMVDPDNRLPVDFDKRKKMLEAMPAEEERGAVLAYCKQHATEGAQKIFLIREILHFRRNYPDLFSKGQYLPVISTANLIGYIRMQEEHQLLILAPLPSRTGEKYTGGISGIQGRWKNILTGEQWDLHDSIDTSLLLKEFPVAALVLQKA